MTNARPRRVPLAHRPTPLEPLVRLADGRGPRLWVKRDDATGLAGGGNKVRKLEYLLGAGLDDGVDFVLTAGSAQSNHARQTAAACARLGLDCELIVDLPLGDAGEEYERSGNALIGRLVGAQVRRIDTASAYEDANETLEAALWERAAELDQEGRRPLVIPLGGSNGVGALGYVDAALELAEQFERERFMPDAIVLATSSGATHVGLASGFAQIGLAPRLIGVLAGGDEALVRRRSQVVADGLALMGLPAVRSGSLELDPSQVGDGYGLPTEACLAAIREVASREGLLLDPVYTGKAMAGLLDRVRRGELSEAANVVFIHTGGWPALFAYRRLFEADPALSEAR